MKKEWLLLAGSVTFTLLVALGLIRWLAPHLIGMAVPIDLRVVQVADKVPPFFEVALPFSALDPDAPLTNDPYVGHRHSVMIPENQVFNAPFDLLGFRNRSVPVVVDVIAIGDSQTVGPNAPIDLNWPSQLRSKLVDGNISVYNASVGGWGAIQYLYMFDKLALMRPRVAVVAFYTGNDPVDSVHLVYNFESWADMRQYDGKPKAPPSAWPPKAEDLWSVHFKDGVATEFTAKSRLAMNDRDYPRTTEGYRIMAVAAAKIDALAAERGIDVVYTIIPTKELVYGPKMQRDRIAPPEDYQKLVSHESQNISELASALIALPHGHYVDVVVPMQRAALGAAPLYRDNSDGHPVAYGYQVIASALFPQVKRLLPAPLKDGIVMWADPEHSGTSQTYLVRDGGVYRFGGIDVYTGNGWRPGKEVVRQVTLRELAGYEDHGVVSEVNPALYGPRR